VDLIRRLESQKRAIKKMVNLDEKRSGIGAFKRNSELLAILKTIRFSLMCFAKKTLSVSNNPGAF
jgi:hypothetical protein